MTDPASEPASPDSSAPSSEDAPHESLHAVLLETARPVDAAAIGRALAALLGTAAHDGARRARDAGGLEVVVRAPASQGGARRRDVRYGDVRLAVACALDAGESTRKEEPSKRQRGVGAAPELRAFDRDPETLLAGEDAGLEPEAVRLLSGIARRRKEERRETGLLLDLVLAGGGVVRLRREGLRAIDAESGRGHSMARFTEIAKEATATVAALGGASAAESQTLLWNGLLAPALFRTEDELARYERWMLARRPDGDPASAPGASPGTSMLPPTGEIA